MECACRVQGDVVWDICGLHMRMIRDASAKAVAGVVAAEREACAKNLDQLAKLAEMMGDQNAWRALRSAADGFRAIT